MATQKKSAGKPARKKTEGRSRASTRGAGAPAPPRVPRANAPRAARAVKIKPLGKIKPAGKGKSAGRTAVLGAIPEIYDRYVVPMLFETYAQHIAARCATCRPSDVLELAAGTGAVTRELARRMPEARIVATDIDPSMIDYAATRVKGAHIAWRQADAQALPFEDASFDAVICQFGASHFADKVAAFREARRVLRPRGAFLFNTWDRIEENGFAREAMWGLCVLCSDDSPQFMLRAPHSYYDPGTIRDHLRTAGFTDVSIATVEHRSYAKNPRAVAIALCQGTPLRAEIVERGLSLEAATNAVAAAIAGRFGVGEVEGKIRALVVEGR